GGEIKAKIMFAFYSPYATFLSGVFNRSRPRPLVATAKPVILSVSGERASPTRPRMFSSEARRSKQPAPPGNNYDSAKVNRMVNSATRYIKVIEANAAQAVQTAATPKTQRALSRAFAGPKQIPIFSTEV